MQYRNFGARSIVPQNSESRPVVRSVSMSILEESLRENLRANVFHMVPRGLHKSNADTFLPGPLCG
jgi:hypothetical protein